MLTQSLDWARTQVLAKKMANTERRADFMREFKCA
jgi:hypothetical protein